MNEEDQGDLVCLPCGLSFTDRLAREGEHLVVLHRSSACCECGRELAPRHTLTAAQQFDLFRPRTRREVEFASMVESLVQRLRLLKEHPELVVDVRHWLDVLPYHVKLALDCDAASDEYFHARDVGAPHDCDLDEFILQRIGHKP